MVRIGFQELADKIDNGTASIIETAANAARSFYCGLYNDTPGWVLRRNPLVSPVARSALANICSAEGLPPPIEENPNQFRGGQCVAELYRVRYRYSIGDGDEVFESQQNVWGSVRGIFVEPTGTGSVKLFILAGDGTLADNARDYDLIFAAATGNPFPGYAITSVELLTGDEDNCGDSPEYQPPPAPPTDDQIRNNYETTLVNGDNIDIDITINRSDGDQIFFPPVINVGGVSVDIDATGIGIGEVNIGTRSGGGGNGSPDLTNDDGGNADTEAVEQPPEEVDESIEKTVENLIAIKVDITSVPSNAKIVSGRGAPDIIYAGWVEFKTKGFYYPRTFIDFRQGYYPAPEENDGYAVTFKKGFNGAIIEVREEEVLDEI